ncbi:unnamed protein product [Polarella glacialis]|uniref:Apple domain-containing protein n=1 Tax=Polarella glacialis TaxID=89957 RepID=A0A813FEL7_POLGL|nr:unnamed protein product [Polarella glacialis]
MFQCTSLPACPTAPDLPLGLPGYAAHDTETPAGAKLDCTSSSSIMPSTSSIMPSTSTTTTSSMDIQAYMCALEVEILGAGTGAINGVYRKVPNRQNAEVGRGALTECELCATWQNVQYTFGILSNYKLTSFTCLRNDLAPVFSPVDGGKDRACRGATSSDNSDSYYKVFSDLSLRDCQSKCMDEALCKGIEHSTEYGHNNGHCEIWTLSYGISSSVLVAGYTCMSYNDKAPPLTLFLV